VVQPGQVPTAVDLQPEPAYPAVAGRAVERHERVADDTRRHRVVPAGEGRADVVVVRAREQWRAAASAGAVRVEVVDRGPVVGEQVAERIFTRFAQADSSDARPKGGTGLGLAICKAIVERLGGRVGFDSPPGGPTVFWFELAPAP